MEYEIRRADELTHWGVRGMKWGVRRYQNKDGSLTPRGKKRYEAELKKVREQEKVLKNRQATRAKIEKLEARKKAAADEQDALDAAEGKNKKHKLFGRKAKAEETPKKTIKDMSDVELFEAINRARMEDTYRQLRPEVVEKSKPFKKLIDDVVTPAATNAGKKLLEDAIKQVGNKWLDDKLGSDSIEAMTKMRDKLKLKNEIETLKKGPSEPEKSAKDKLTQVQYEKAKWEFEKAKANATKEAADAKANAAKEAADAKAQADKVAEERRKSYRSTMTLSNRENKTVKPLIPRSELEMFSKKTEQQTPAKQTEQQASAGKTFVDSHGDILFTTSPASRERGKTFVDSHGNTLFMWGDD